MTENEAIEELRTSIYLGKMCVQNRERKREIQGYEMAIQALEKQMPMKPYHISPVDDNDNANVECPECHATTDYAVNVIKRGHCWKCGQLLDWSDEE